MVTIDTFLQEVQYLCQLDINLISQKVFIILFSIMIHYDGCLKGVEGGLQFSSSMGRMLSLQVVEGEELIVLTAVVAEVRSSFQI